MKNKIVKALVLASIVSMTATGAAGLTFADDDVVTGDTTSTSTTITTTKVDDLADALTKAQDDAATKEATFTKAYEDYEKAVNANKDATNNTALNKKRTAVNKALRTLNLEEESTYSAIQDVIREIDPDGQQANSVPMSYLNDVKTKFQAYSQARTNYIDALNNDQEAVPANTKKAYEDALKAFKESLSAATGFDKIKETEAFADLDAAIKAEDEKRSSFEDALAEVVKIRDERAKLTAEDKEKLAAAVTTAKTALKAATTSYKDALAKVKTAAEAYTNATKGLVPVFRVFHPGTLEHLYTTGAHERDVLVEKGWKDEKVAWLTVDKDAEGAAPVYRLCYPGTGDHHYTTDKNERDTLIKTQGWIDETVAFYVPKKGDASVYRVYLSSLKIGAHHFTTGRNEYDTLVQNGWRPEGVSFEVSAKDWIDVKDVKTEDERIAKAEELTKD